MNSQFGITRHAQCQTINGTSVVLQPEHLMCDRCWDMADTAFSHWRAFGDGGAVQVCTNGERHGIYINEGEHQ